MKLKFSTMKFVFNNFYYCKKIEIHNGKLKIEIETKSFVNYANYTLINFLFLCSFYLDYIFLKNYF